MLGKTKKNLALKITLGLVLALPVGTALAADSIVDYDTLTVKPNAEFIYHARAIRKQILLLQILNAVKRNVYMEFLLGIKPF